MISVTEATTKQLIAFYNEHSEKPVKKFQDRATAERRVQAMIDEMTKEPEMAEEQLSLDEREAAEDAALIEAHGTTHCPSCDVHLSNGVDVNEKTGATVCLGCGHEWNATKKARATNPDHGAAIARTWQDKEVRAARTTRHSVTVSGGDLKEPAIFRSVRQAFSELGLPDNKHVKFRAEVKAAEGAEVEGFGYIWKAQRTH